LASAPFGRDNVLMHELEHFLRQVEADLASEYSRIMARATEDPGTAGDEGEENWAEFLRSWLPETYKVVTKGRILSVDGDASPQIDIIVLKPSYPPALRNKKMYLAGGVAAAFECKTTLKKAHVTQAIDTAREVQRLAHPSAPRSSRQGSPYVELHSPLVYGLLAHAHSWTPESAAGHVNGALLDGLLQAEHPRDVLDVVCVANLANWSATRMSYLGPALNMWHLDQQRDKFPEGYASCTVFGPPDGTQWGEAAVETFPEIPVAQLCAYLTSRLAWEDTALRSVADYFRVAGLFGRGEGQGRPWPLDAVYSPDVAAALARGRVEQSPWSPWSLMFM